MILWSLLLCIVVVAVFDTILVVVLRVRNVGDFKHSSVAEQSFSFSSCAGTFAVNSATKSIVGAGGGSRLAIRLDEIAGLEYKVTMDHVALREIFQRSELIGFLLDYGDRVEWHCISLITQDGRRFPIYLRGRKHPSLPMLGWYFNLQAWLLAQLNLVPDLEEESREALELIHTSLNSPTLF